VPAAAVIPAPIAYIKVAAVKKLVVGSQSRASGSPHGCFNCCAQALYIEKFVAGSHPRCPSLGAWKGGRSVYFEKIGVLKAGV
jgi:hypothetical protein